MINGPVEPESYAMHCGPAVFDLLRHPAILDVVESVIGPEIASNPVQQMRMKPSQDMVADESLRVCTPTWGSPPGTRTSWPCCPMPTTPGS